MVEKSDTKTEALLNILGNGGDASPYRGSGNTKVENYILDAIDRIENLQPGGTKTLSSADYNWNSQSGDTTPPLNSIALWLLPEGSYLVSPETNLTLSSENISGGGIIDPTVAFPQAIWKVEKINNPKGTNIIIKIYDSLYNGMGVTSTFLDDSGSLMGTLHNERYGWGGAPDNFEGNIGDVFVQTAFPGEPGKGSMYILAEIVADEETGDTRYSWERVMTQQV